MKYDTLALEIKSIIIKALCAKVPVWAVLVIAITFAVTQAIRKPKQTPTPTIQSKILYENQIFRLNQQNKIDSVAYADSAYRLRVSYMSTKDLKREFEKQFK